MKLFLILASIMIFSLFGIIGMQESFAGQPMANLSLKDADGKSVNVPKINEQYTLSWTVNNYLRTFIPCTETIMVNASQFDFSNRTWGFGEKEKCVSGNKWIIDERINDYPPSPITLILYVTDNEDKSTYLAWIDASVPPNDSKTFEFSWTPFKTGEHTLTVFTWKSLDNPTALSPPSSTSIHVGKIDFSAFSENKPNVILGCTLANGIWLDEYNECEDQSITEEFENYCSLYGGMYDGCDSGCRNAPDYPETVCTTQCVAVCEFE